MKNKKLETLLTDGDYEDIIKLIEKCEQGRILEIKITEEEGITKDENLDKKLFNYLKKLKVKLTFITEKDYQRSKNKYYKPKKACNHAVHAIVDRKASKEAILDELHYDGYKTFSVDGKSYISCSKCWHILPILGVSDNGKTKKRKDG